MGLLYQSTDKSEVYSAIIVYCVYLVYIVRYRGMNPLSSIEFSSRAPRTLRRLKVNQELMHLT